MTMLTRHEATKIFAASALACAGWGLAPKAHAEDLDPGGIRIRNMTYSGTGCPEGSVAANLAPDAQAVTLLFDSFAIDQSGTGTTSKDCKVKLKLRMPSGWSVGIFAVDFRGYASLEQGVRGRQMAGYRFGAGSEREVGVYEMSGPLTLDYQNRIEIPLESVHWSDCDGGNEPLIIGAKIDLKSNARGGNGILTVDSIDGAIVQEYGLAWKRCELPEERQPPVLQTVGGLLAATMDAESALARGDGKPPVQILAGTQLVPGDVLYLDAASGVSLGRVYHGNPTLSSPCPASWKVHFRRADGSLIQSLMAPSDLALDMAIPVPVGATSAWIGYRETNVRNYFDNEGMGGTRTPRTGSSNGCTFDFRLERGIIVHAPDQGPSPDEPQMMEETLANLTASIMDAASMDARKNGKPAQQVFANSALVPGSIITLTELSGISATRVHGGRIESSSPCPNGWKLNFRTAAGAIIRDPSTSEILSDFVNGVTVPPGAASAWIGIVDSNYSDNEGMTGRTPRSGSTQGCTFSFAMTQH